MAAEPGKTVRTRDGHEVDLDAALLEDSAILRNLPAIENELFTLGCTKETLDLLLRAHRDKILPSDCWLTYRLLALTMKLQLESLIRSCLKHLFRTADFWRYNYPDEIPDAVVRTCFEESLNRLYRTAVVYQHEISEITKLHRGNDQNESILNALVLKIREFTELELDPVPIYFSTRSLPIGIINRRGKPETAICHMGECVPFELFGKYFDLSSVKIDAFYLKYASYVLYKSRDKVYTKDLRQPTKASQVKENCTCFISREDYVFVVTAENAENRISMWIENEEHGNNFATIHRKPDTIVNLDFATDSKHLLILEEYGCLSVMELGDQELVPMLELDGGFHSAWCYEGCVFTFSLVYGKEDEFRVRRIKLRWDSLSDEDETFDEESYGETDHETDELEEFAKGGRLASLGGAIFKVSPHAVEVFDHSHRDGRKILKAEELIASSELHLHP